MRFFFSFFFSSKYRGKGVESLPHDPFEVHRRG